MFDEWVELQNLIERKKSRCKFLMNYNSAAVLQWVLDQMTFLEEKMIADMEREVLHGVENQ